MCVFVRNWQVFSSENLYWYCAWIDYWAASSKFGTYRLCEQRRFRRAWASTQSRQNLRCSLIQAVSQEEPSDRKPDPRPLWMAGHVQLQFVMTECSKTQIRLTRHNWKCKTDINLSHWFKVVCKMQLLLLEPRFFVDKFWYQNKLVMQSCCKWFYAECLIKGERNFRYTKKN